MVLKWRNLFVFLTIAFAAMLSSGHAIAQSAVPTPESQSRYLDQINGTTADAAVARTLENNGEILALRKEVDAARALVKQAGLRANPTLEAGAAEQFGGMDNMRMVQGTLPLELGGRRAARVKVSQRELEVREFGLANQERLLAAEVREKFGEALAAIKKLAIIEKNLAAAQQGYDLVSARVTEGKIAPLEQNIFLVEVNRLRSIRETSEGKAETAMLELRNLIGIRPEDPLRLKGDFSDLISSLPSLFESTNRALSERPDLAGTWTVEQLADARIEQARSEGRLEASIKSGYQRTDTGFPLNAFDESGTLRPIQGIFHSFTFGVELMLPVRNRNQGAIEAAVNDREAARNRAAFGELTIRREVSVGFARYNRAARALSIFQNGVRDQANANLQVIWQTYELGSRTLLEYIAEQRRFFEIENELVDAELEVYYARIGIMRATNAPELK